jgi:hypothetical protein
VEQVIAKVRALADEFGGDADVVERVYRAMIAGSGCGVGRAENL